jgi:uncharacterized membrane protein
VDARQFDDIIRQYLKRVRDRLYDLPESDRAEIIGDLQAHIDDAIRESGAATEADVRNVLERLGDPETLAREARERVVNGEPSAPQLPVYRRVKTGPGALEVAAIVLTALVWPVGLLLAWISGRWRTRDKAVASIIPVVGIMLLFTFLVPVGIFGMRAVQSVDSRAPIAVPAAPPAVGDSPVHVIDRSHHAYQPSLTSQLLDVAGRVLAMLSLVFGLIGAPFISALYLALRIQPAEETLYPDGTRIERVLNATGTAHAGPSI